MLKTYDLLSSYKILNLKPKPGFTGSGPPIFWFPGTGKNREIANPNRDRISRVRMDPNIPVMTLPDTIWSFQILTRPLESLVFDKLKHQKGAWKCFFLKSV